MNEAVGGRTRSQPQCLLDRVFALIALQMYQIPNIQRSFHRQIHSRSVTTDHCHQVHTERNHLRTGPDLAALALVALSDLLTVILYLQHHHTPPPL